MKGAFIMILFSVGLHSYGQSDSMINFQRSIPIKDVVETLSECDCIVMRMRGNLNEREAKLISRAQAILVRDFSELDSLFHFENKVISVCPQSQESEL